MNKVLFRILRGFGGLNQEELGQLLGKTQPTIARYETGVIQIPMKVAEEMTVLVRELGITDYDIYLLQELIKASADAKKVGAWE